MQLVNRVGWDGMIKPPDPNELGWKETVRMNPLEDAIVAFRPVSPSLPFKVPDSVRPLDPTQPLGTTTQFSGWDPATGNPITVTNELVELRLGVRVALPPARPRRERHDACRRVRGLAGRPDRD